SEQQALAARHMNPIDGEEGGSRGSWEICGHLSTCLRLGVLLSSKLSAPCSWSGGAFHPPLSTRSVWRRCYPTPTRRAPGARAVGRVRSSCDAEATDAFSRRAATRSPSNTCD